MTTRFRKRPFEVEAVQVRPVGNLTGEPREAMAFIRAGDAECEWDRHARMLHVVTLEGRMRATVGDWIIRGVEGEFYPCKPRIFEATYEPVAVSKGHTPEQDAQIPIKIREAARREVKAAVEEWFSNVSLDDLFAVKGWVCSCGHALSAHPDCGCVGAPCPATNAAAPDALLCSQCGERDSAMVKIGTTDGWCTACLDEAATDVGEGGGS